ncbi:hypothetical protein Bca52824_087298 [Brassica carinata]|uniref:DUF629 domain-containing protein n=1 Tax=Brassica carinata TaxID=52824 RepID=A0A8X7PAL8_BRACI|nr:hypothetical protein Bca52824_087298 [Brassica carinata]
MSPRHVSLNQLRMQLVPVYCSSPSVNPPPYIDCNFIFDLTIFELNRGWVRRRNPPRLAPNNLCLLTTRRFGSCSRHQHSALINCVREGRFYEEVLSLLENLWRYHQTLSIANLLYEADNDARERHKILTPEVRTANVQDELRSLIQKSTWVKHLENGEGKLRRGEEKTWKRKEKRLLTRAKKRRKDLPRVKLCPFVRLIRSGGSWFATGVVRSSWIIVREHIGIVLIYMQMVLPESLHNERIELLLSSPWKPLDLPAAVKMLCSQKTIHNTEFNEFHSGDYMEDAASHYDKVIQFTVDELRNLPSGSQLLNRGLGQSPTCIRFLEATPLSKILRFLQHLSATFGLSRYSGIQEKYMGSALNNGAISIMCLLLRMDFFHGFSHDPLARNKLGSRGQNKGLEVMEILEKEFCHLQNPCERKMRALKLQGSTADC